MVGKCFRAHAALAHCRLGLWRSSPWRSEKISSTRRKRVSGRRGWAEESGLPGESPHVCSLAPWLSPFDETGQLGVLGHLLNTSLASSQL